MTTIGKAVVAVAVLVAVGVGLYVWSDVFSTKVDEAAKQAREWTPENIAKDPAAYLAFCEKETLRTVADLKAAEIRAQQTRAKLLTMSESAQGKVGAGKKALQELKQLYGDADASGNWPVTWRGTSRDRDWIRSQIVSLHKQVEHEDSLSLQCQEGMRKCDAQVDRIKELRQKAQEQISEVKVAKSQLAVSDLSSGLQDRLVAMRAALQGLAGSVTDVDGMVDLDTLAAENAVSFTEEEFQEILRSD